MSEPGTAAFHPKRSFPRRAGRHVLQPPSRFWNGRLFRSSDGPGARLFTAPAYLLDTTGVPPPVTLPAPLAWGVSAAQWQFGWRRRDPVGVSMSKLTSGILDRR